VNHGTADPRGIESLFLGMVAGKPAAAADLPTVLTALRAAGQIPRLDEIALADAVTFGTPLGRRTLVQGVRRLHPGERFTTANGATTIQPAGPLPSPAANDVNDLDGWSDVYLAALRQALGPALESRNGLGCALSGGLDSRTLIALLRSMDARPIAVTFGRPEHPDRLVAGTIAARAGFQHLCCDLPADGPLDHLDEIARLTGGTGNLALLAGISTHRTAADRVDRLVSGASGDALFGPLPPAADDDPDGLRAALPRLRDDRRRLLLPDAPAVEERLEEAREIPLAAAGRDARRLAQQLRWRQARVTADGLRLRQAHTPVTAPFLDPQVVGLALILPPRLRKDRALQRAALARIAPDLAALPLVPDRPSPAALWRATRYLRGRADHLARNLWLRGTPDRGAQFDIQTALRTRPAWRAAMHHLCATPPPGIDGDGLRSLWRRHRRGRDNLGLLFGRLLVLGRFVECWL
jgi:asparagine synthetase B (glutamine-hydrolysing)